LSDNLGQFITLIGHYYVQHDTREASRRAGLSDIADACLVQQIRRHFEGDVRMIRKQRF